jgi:hypothetical protein
MSAPLIDTLIDKLDSFELVRNEVAAILLAETTSQQTKAIAAGKPTAYPWQFRVYLERTNPWAEFQELPDEQTAPVVPIVNVWFNGLTADLSGSNVIERQKVTSTIFVDVYTYAVSEDVEAGGHRPGDQLAAIELHRVVRLVRNMLMAGTYAWLGLRGLVARRWISSIDVLEPALDVRAAQRIGAARITLLVDHQEYSPQVTGEPLEALSAQVERESTGQIYFTATFP